MRKYKIMIVIGEVLSGMGVGMMVFGMMILMG